MRIVFMGTPDFAAVSLQRLLDEVASERLANEHGALVRRAERLYRSGWRGETDGRE